MSITELRRQIKKKVDELPVEQLQSANDFVAYLKDRQPSRAAKELRRYAQFRDRLSKAEDDVSAGRVTPVAKLRRKY